MEHTLLVYPVVGVGAEEVALTLDEGGGQARRANLVEVGQGRGEHGDRNAGEGRLGHDATQRGRALLEAGRKRLGGQQQRQIRIGLVGAG